MVPYARLENTSFGQIQLSEINQQKTPNFCSESGV
jgi:hypothetical protein